MYYLKLCCIAAFIMIVSSDCPPGAQCKPRIVEQQPAPAPAREDPAPPAEDDKPPPEDDSGKKPKKKKKGARCFHGEDRVITDIGQMSVAELFVNKDAQVLTRSDEGKLEFASVNYWIHAQSDVETEFYIYDTESGNSLSITGMHLIYQTDCEGNSEAIFAEKVKVGKCLLVNDNGNVVESKVINKRIEKKAGIYAPITATGNIVVNNVLASCFSDVENEAIQKIMYSYINHARTLYSMIPSSIVDLFYSSQSDTTVQVPQVVLSFLELSKSYFK